MKSSITPILIFGENRNGTTWLGNTLIKEFDVFMPHHKLHFGMLETSIYSINQKWKRFNSDEDYQAFLTQFSNSDLFITSHGNLEDYKNANFDNYYAFFLDLIHQAALKQNKKAWAIKVEPRLLYHKREWNTFLALIKQKYDSINYLVIQRDFDGYFLSAKNLYTISKTKNNLHNFGWINSAIVCARYKKFYQTVDQLSKSWNQININYSTFKNDYENTLSKISAYLQMSRSAKENNFLKNTSTDVSKYKPSTLDKLICGFINKSIFANKIIIGIQELLYKILKPNTDYIKYRIKKLEEDPSKLLDEIPDAFEKEFNKFDTKNE